MNNLSDAFKQLDCLNEDTFEVTPEGIEELQVFKDEDYKDDVVDIIDINVDDEEDLEDSYIGKVICQCDICKSLVYFDKNEIIVDEDSDTVNNTEECPYCFSSNGFKVIGEVSPFKEVSVEAIDDDGNEVDVDIEVNEHEDASEIADEEDTNGADDEEDTDDTSETEYTEDVDNEEDNKVVEDDEDLKELSNIRGNRMRRLRRYSESLDSIKLDDGAQEIEIKTKEKEEQPKDTMITPPSDDTIEDILTDEEDIMPEDGDEVEADIDEIDEESFDDLAESYLKKVYENVRSFKTVKAYANENNIKLEGIIKFNSGKTKRTSFIFESSTINSKGRVKFLGENKDIARGKKSFTMYANIRHNKLLPESMTYNYRAKLQEGRSTKVYGTVKLNEGLKRYHR